MPRPRQQCRVCFEPNVSFFKPAGVPLNKLVVSTLSMEEAEAIRLAFVESLNQTEAAAHMHISQPTFHRILQAGQQKIADALVNGKAIKIHGGNFFRYSKRRRCRHHGARKP